MSDTDEITGLRAENERLREALRAWDDAVKIYPTMEGPRYAGLSSELAKKAWALTSAALDGQTAPGKEGGK